MNSNNEEEKKMRIHHIGYFVPKIKNALECFKHLGFHAESEIIYDNERGINVIFISNGHSRIELIEKKEGTCKIEFLTKMNYACPYHICYEVSDITAKVEQLKERKFIVVKNREKACVIDNREVVFMYSKHGGLIELLSEE